MTPENWNIIELVAATGSCIGSAVAFVVLIWSWRTVLAARDIIKRAEELERRVESSDFILAGTFPRDEGGQSDTDSE